MKNATKTWEQQERSITLTNAEWNKLTCYILMTSKYREGERDAWAKLAEERNAAGNATFAYAADNAKYWAEMDGFLLALKEKIDKAP